MSLLQSLTGGLRLHVASVEWREREVIQREQQAAKPQSLSRMSLQHSVVGESYQLNGMDRENISK